MNRRRLSAPEEGLSTKGRVLFTRVWMREQAALVVRECEAGTLILGDYSRVLHGNLATIAGNRMVINAYCSKTTVDRISK